MSAPTLDLTKETAMIKFITRYRTDNFFLVVDRGEAYIVNYQHRTDEYGGLCPCCMNDDHRRSIMAAVKEGIASGIMGTRTVLWCSPTSYPGRIAFYGNDLTEPFLEQRFFAAGVAEGISAETKAQLREEALRLVAAGKIY
jgi:hypothetical protein